MRAVGESTLEYVAIFLKYEEYRQQIRDDLLLRRTRKIGSEAMFLLQNH